MVALIAVYLLGGDARVVAPQGVNQSQDHLAGPDGAGLRRIPNLGSAALEGEALSREREVDQDAPRI